jgi:hypothetical protein
VYSNEPLIAAKMSALAGAGQALGRPTSSLERRLILQNVEQRRSVSLLRYMYRITLQNLLLSDTDRYSLRFVALSTVPMSRVIFTVIFNVNFTVTFLWTLCPCALKITVGKTPNHKVPVAALQSNSLQNSYLLFHVSILTSIDLSFVINCDSENPVGVTIWRHFFIFESEII